MISLNRNKIFILLVTIYLGLGPVVWFASFSIGNLKRVILIIIILLFVNDIFGNKIKGLFKLLLLYSFLFTSLWINYDSSHTYSGLIFGVLENILFYMIGYVFIEKKYYLKGYILKMIIILSFFCFFTISNAIIGVPDWYTPFFQIVEEEINKTFEYDKLWSTGFSWSRAGWGCSLCLYIPICFMFFKEKHLRWQTITCLSLIFLSLFICGCRSGLVGTVIATYFVIHSHGEFNISRRKYIFLVLVVIIVMLFNSDTIIEHLRIGEDEATLARLEQYDKIPDLIRIMGFWGMGDGVTKEVLSNLIGRNHAFHNTYIRNFIEYGFLYGTSLIIFSLSIIAKFFRSLKEKNNEIIVYGSVLLSGMIAAMFEPALIFGYLGGFCLWWFSLGAFMNLYYKNKTLKQV